jgi:hypothetical protein
MARREEPDDKGPGSFAVPIIGAAYGSLVIVAVVAILNSDVGRSLEGEVNAPARAMIAIPIVIAASVVSIASLMAMMLPGSRRVSLRVAEIAAWLIPAWLVMGAMVLGAVSFALHRAD